MRVFTDLSALPTFRNAVLTIGSFDGVHLGHRRILDQLCHIAKRNDGESVVITFDPHPRTVLRPEDNSFRLLNTTPEKIELLKAAGVDNVVVVPFTTAFAQQSPLEYVEDFLIKKFNPGHIIIGYDHRFGAGRAGDIHLLKSYAEKGHFQVIEIPAHEVDELAVSSSNIRKALESSDIIRANRLLGHSFSFSGIVVDGNRLGRQIGFPTANLEIRDPYKMVLPEGIYAAKAICNGVSYDAALYIGDRPTLSAGGKRVIEVHLIDFQGDIYGQALQVDVFHFIRGDKKLPDLQALQQQIAEDKAAILEWFAQQTDKTPDVAIVILNYNTRRHLEQFLPSVTAHSAGARIIVADNGSPDDSIDFLRRHYPDIAVIDLERNWGFAEGYNRALAQVKADIYVVLNSDVEVAPNWLKPVIDTMRARPDIAVAQPKILAWEAGRTAPPYTFEYAGASGGWIDLLGYPFCRGRIFSRRETDTGQYDTPQACFWASGAAFFIRAELYHTFGGFDGDYFAHNEEIDLCWRLKRAGYGIWCIPQSTVWHLGGGTLEYENPRKVFLNFRNSLYSLLKNEPWSKLLWLIPARFVLDGIAGARFAAKGQFKAIWAIVRGHFSFYSHIGLMLEKRRAIAQIIEKHRIAPEEKNGVYPGSIIVAHYLRRVKQFSKLNRSEPQHETSNHL